MHSLTESFDPRNVTLEPEYYGDVDAEKYAIRKPLIWFWQMFDRSPLGLNHWLGFRFRCMLGRHIFSHLGKHVKIFHNVEFTYGYNLTIDDSCTIHKNVLLDDRGEIILHEGTSVSDYANVYSQTHNINLQANVTNKLTELGPRARITYHAHGPRRSQRWRKRHARSPRPRHQTRPTQNRLRRHPRPLQKTPEEPFLMAFSNCHWFAFGRKRRALALRKIGALNGALAPGLSAANHRACKFRPKSDLYGSFAPTPVDLKLI